MAQRVLSTQEAKTAVTQMQSIVNGDLTSTIDNLKKQGQTLSDPNVWDGNLANQFRGDVWPTANTALDNMKTQLEELRQQVQKINDDIMAAGGG
ncbi:MAG: pyrophosphorylase [Egibacteraceae bacterium]